jgi:hypothetical protein
MSDEAAKDEANLRAHELEEWHRVCRETATLGPGWLW